MTREEIMKDPAVHNLTKDILRLAEGKDCVDAYYDIKIALEILEQEMYVDLGITLTQ